MTRPDIAYAVNIVSQFMHAPRTTHLHCVKRIFRYLQEAEYRAITYTVAETSWIRNILHDIGLYLRNQFMFFVAQGDLVVRYVPTRLQFADIFTKGLPSSQFSFLRDNQSVMSSSPD
uniref:Mitochondrial protein n=1 Tax=Nicotiana tabacum TaxID=4097 RepID=A0A1S3YLW0_TOBAC|nr:PREDICTED: uncharacterized protein LOC107777423 [Nicotiana tabacum]